MTLNTSSHLFLKRKNQMGSDRCRQQRVAEAEAGRPRRVRFSPQATATCLTEVVVFRSLGYNCPDDEMAGTAICAAIANNDSYASSVGPGFFLLISPEVVMGRPILKQ